MVSPIPNEGVVKINFNAAGGTPKFQSMQIIPAPALKPVETKPEVFLQNFEQENSGHAGKLLIGLGIAVAILAAIFAPYVGMIVAAASTEFAGVWIGIGTAAAGGLLCFACIKVGVGLLPPKELPDGHLSKLYHLPGNAVGAFVYDDKMDRKMDKMIKSFFQNMAHKFTNDELMDDCIEQILPKNAKASKELVEELRQKIAERLERLIADGEIAKVTERSRVTYMGVDRNMCDRIERAVRQSGEIGMDDLVEAVEKDSYEKGELTERCLSVLENQKRIGKYMKTIQVDPATKKAVWKEAVYMTIDPHIYDTILMNVKKGVGFTAAQLTKLVHSDLASESRLIKKIRPPQELVEKYLEVMIERKDIKKAFPHGPMKPAVYWDTSKDFFWKS